MTLESYFTQETERISRQQYSGIPAGDAPGRTDSNTWNRAEAVAKRRTILFEENYTRYLNLLREALDLKGYHIIQVANGEETVKEARLRKPDLIILNTQIPLRLETARQLKTQRATSAIPVWTLSANNLPGEETKFIEAGCEIYQDTPMDIDQARLFLEQIDNRLALAERS